MAYGKRLDVGKLTNIAILGVVGLVGYSIYKKLFQGNPFDFGSALDVQGKEQKDEFRKNVKLDIAESSDAITKARALLSRLGLSVNTSHKTTANTLEKAMAGLGTDWSKIAVIKTMAPATLACVFVAYGVRKTQLALWPASPVEGNLIDHLQDDLSESEFKELTPYFKKASLL